MNATNKWADYTISAVSYNMNHEHIERVKVMLDNGENLSSPEIVARELVVNNLERGFSYVTVYQDNLGKWKKGDNVEVVPINGKHFIRTDGNRIAKDNLGELPEF